MDELREALQYAHIAFGFVGLVAFWIPIVTKKGSVNHKRFGTVFLWCVYGIAASAIIATSHELGSALLDGSTPASDPGGFGFGVFLFYIAVITLASGHHGARTMRTKRDRQALATPFNYTLAIGSIVGSVVTIVYALMFWSGMSIVFLALGPVGLGIGYDMLRYMRGANVPKMEFWYAHMGAMLGAGIAFHTAFLVFGSQNLINYEALLGNLNWLPWVIPVAIGVPASIVWTRHYRRKFGDLPAKASRTEGSRPTA